MNISMSIRNGNGEHFHHNYDYYIIHLLIQQVRTNCYAYILYIYVIKLIHY